MIILFHQSLNPVIQPREDLFDASTVYLLYTAFPGDIELSHNGNTIITQFGWVPLLNVVIELPSAVEAAISNGTGRYSFTESDDYLSFQCRDGELEICATFSEAVILVAVNEFREALKVFRESSIRYVKSKNPELEWNQHFRLLFE